MPILWTEPMKVPIKHLDVEGFRAFNHLRVGPFGRVNLITGKNNAGKSSLLEAIRIAASGGAPRTLFDILYYREELGTSELDRVYAPTDVAPFCNLFHGVPEIANCEQGFTLAVEGNLPASSLPLTVRIGYFIQKMDPERRVALWEPTTVDLFDDLEGVPALQVDTGGRTRVIPLDRLVRRSSAYRNEGELTPTPCVYLDPFSSRSTSHLGALWDAVALTDAEKELVEALKVISPEISAVSMIGGDERAIRSRTVIAKSSSYRTPMPLRTFGDGVNRLFGVILSLCNAKDGILVVDEIDNGLHYSVQSQIWKIVFRLAKTLNVQVFATSHSWDCVRAFQQAASDSPEDGVLVRLTKRQENVAATLFTERELEIATRDQIEVR